MFGRILLKYYALASEISKAWNTKKQCPPNPPVHGAALSKIFVLAPHWEAVLVGVSAVHVTVASIQQASDT